jgi:hypothetical protein
MAAVVCAVIGLAGCGTNPVTIASDDAALCRFAAEAGSAESAAACRGRLDNQHRGRIAANASRIEGYALLNTPAPPTAIADQCKQSSPPAECEAGDVTGTIKRDPDK